MASKTFIDNDPVAGLVDAEWLNEVDAVVHDVFGGAATAGAINTALGLGVADTPTFASLNLTAALIAAGITLNGNMSLGYNNILTFGFSGFEFYHTGSLGYLINNTGNLELINVGISAFVTISTYDSGEVARDCIECGGATPNVKLNHNGNVQLITTATGINISNVPTSASGLVSGDVWANSGVLTIVA